MILFSSLWLGHRGRGAQGRRRPSSNVYCVYCGAEVTGLRIDLQCLYQPLHNGLVLGRAPLPPLLVDGRVVGVVEERPQGPPQPLT